MVRGISTSPVRPPAVRTVTAITAATAVTTNSVRYSARAFRAARFHGSVTSVTSATSVTSVTAHALSALLGSMGFFYGSSTISPSTPQAARGYAAARTPHRVCGTQTPVRQIGCSARSSKAHIQSDCSTVFVYSIAHVSLTSRRPRCRVPTPPWATAMGDSQSAACTRLSTGGT